MAEYKLIPIVRFFSPSKTTKFEHGRLNNRPYFKKPNSRISKILTSHESANLNFEWLL